jgi:hypothetical protein
MVIAVVVLTGVVATLLPEVPLVAGGILLLGCLTALLSSVARAKIGVNWTETSATASSGIQVNGRFCCKSGRLDGSRHSDKEKFPSGLNHPEGCKMSERPLHGLRNFATSKLNTRVRFPSPAPKAISMT